MKKFIKRLFTNRTQRARLAALDELTEESCLKQRQQDREDAAFVRDAKLEALGMFQQYVEQLERNTYWPGYLAYDPIVIPIPRRHLYFCFTTPKYNDEDYKRIREERFNRLKTEYLSKGENFKIEPVGQGKFTILKRNRLYGWQYFMIEDIHPGHGGLEVHPMQASKEDCLKVMRFLKYCKSVKTPVHWTVMDRISKQLHINFTYLHLNN